MSKVKKRRRKEQRAARRQTLAWIEEVGEVSHHAFDALRYAAMLPVEPAKGEYLSRMTSVHGVWRIPYEPDWLLRKRCSRYLIHPQQSYEATKYELFVIKVYEICSKLKATLSWFQRLKY